MKPPARQHTGARWGPRIRRQIPWMGRLGVPRRYLIFGITALGYGLAMFHRMSLAAIATDLREAFQLSGAQLGSLGAYYFYAYAALQIPVGYVVDRWGARRLMSALLALAAAGSLLFALAPSYTWLAVARVAVGLGFAGMFIPSLALITAWFPARDLALWSGMFVAVAAVGTLAAGRPLIEVTARIGWSGAFVIAAALTALTAVGAWVLVRDEPEHCHELPATRVERTPPALRQNLVPLVRSPLLWAIALCGLLLAGTQVSFQSIWAGPYLADVHQLAPAVLGNLLMLIPLAQMAGNVASGWVADRLFRSRTRALLVFVSLYAMLWLPLALAPAGLSVAGLTWLYAGFGFLWAPFILLFPIVRARFRPEVGSTATGVINLFTMTGGALVQQLFGVILDQFAPVQGVYPVAAYTLAFRLSLAFTLVGLIGLSLALLAGRRRQTPVSR